MQRINQDTDEGSTGDIKALELADLRSKIRKMIEGSGGRPDWTKANDIGKSQIPSMCASTIIRFAYGDTKKPSTWTIHILAQLVDYELLIVPAGTVVPGAMKLK